jgi:hypothetical protein
MITQENAKYNQKLTGEPMLSFKRFITEIKLSRLTRNLDSGKPMGTVSAERGEMSNAQKQAAHSALKDALSREAKKGMISFSGQHSGRYKYDANAAPSSEGSYVLKPGNHPKAKENFHRILTHLGAKFGQESVLKVKKQGKGTAGALHYTDGSKKVVSLGHIHYNQPLKKDTGDTRLKGTRSSFTVREGKEKA